MHSDTAWPGRKYCDANIKSVLASSLAYKKFHKKVIQAYEANKCYLCGQLTGFLQGLNELHLNGHGDLFVTPTTSIVLADIEPDQAPAIDIVPTLIPSVRGSLACWKDLYNHSKRWESVKYSPSAWPAGPST